MRDTKENAREVLEKFRDELEEYLDIIHKELKKKTIEGMREALTWLEELLKTRQVWMAEKHRPHVQITQSTFAEGTKILVDPSVSSKMVQARIDVIEDVIHKAERLFKDAELKVVF